MPALGSETILHDRYQVLRHVARGGMGSVFEAVDLRLHNTVAVKKMTVGGSIADAAFEREAQLLAALRHPGLPVVTDYFAQDEARFLVMQYIEGEDLASRFLRLGPCAEADALICAVAILRVLIYLHGHQPPIVHRDIKPANIKMTPRGEFVLLDFGLAKGRPRVHTRRMSEDDVSIFGFTPNYAPLEQLEARGTDPRSDLYALAATVYHLVTGTPPPNAADRSAAIAEGRPDTLSVTRVTSRVSASFGAALVRALQLEQAQRFPSADDMLRAITPDPESVLIHARKSAAPTVRRIDAAVPGCAEVGRAIDLLVQVRFADSPRLGLEDWPTSRRPEHIEQASERIDVEHPRDARTGRELPARLRIKLVAPDFDLRGSDEQLIDVPSDEYSKRVAFLIMPRREGYCRLNVELYGVDAVFLGAIFVETQAVSEAVGESEARTANLVLGVAGSHPAGETTRVVPHGGLITTVDAEPQRPERNRASGAMLRKCAYAAGAAMVMLSTVIVWRSGQAVRPPGPAPPLTSPMTGGPMATPPPTSAGPPPSPAPPPMASTQQPSVMPAPVPPPMQSTPFLAAIASVNHSGVDLQIQSIDRRRPGVLRLNLLIRNSSNSNALLVVDRANSSISDENKVVYRADVGTVQESSTLRLDVNASLSSHTTLDFGVPDSVHGRFELVLATPTSDSQALRFPPVTFTVPAR